MTQQRTIDFFVCIWNLGKNTHPLSVWEVNVIWIYLDNSRDEEKWRVLPAEERHLFSKSLYNSNKVSWLSLVVVCASRHVCGTPLIFKPSQRDLMRAAQCWCIPKSVGAGAFFILYWNVCTFYEFYCVHVQHASRRERTPFHIYPPFMLTITWVLHIFWALTRWQRARVWFQGTKWSRRIDYLIKTRFWVLMTPMKQAKKR